MPEDFSNYRQYYRLSYPLELMPKVVIDSVEYDVPEISEKGFRIRCAELNAFHLNDWVSGQMTFKDEKVARISGRVLRHDKDDYVIANVEGLTLQRLIIEQRGVINRFIKH